ncbi:GNAT family N-acetyltransferase [Antrihabitans cavernicola]|uniref:GNAT family N-acetyltransferase n=1 Tax=Antrihabitans cavernicola TaxID=2495913 RepID=A0A5A7SH17_9NOCA|nr:GNAT family N-acetyltransferase [Spelaeibacter cavernicola]KAA0024007.1 GNAT family N-acetyltransferase [Spelaeibacter cavernicola]
MSGTIRRATPGDVEAIVDLIYQLAEYEKARVQCTVTADQLHATLFGTNPAVFAHVVELDGAVVGTAVWFLNYSTWDGVHGIYLEDLFVAQAHRGSGYGKALLATLARECVDNGYSRLSWAVLDWNAPSIAFYDSLGALPQTEWIGYRLSDSALTALATQV